MATGTVSPSPAARLGYAAGHSTPGFDALIDRRLDKTRRQVKTVDLSVALMTLAAGCLLYLWLGALADHWLVFGGLGVIGRVLLWSGLLLGVPKGSRAPFRGPPGQNAQQKHAQQRSVGHRGNRQAGLQHFSSVPRGNRKHKQHHSPTDRRHSGKKHALLLAGLRIDPRIEIDDRRRGKRVERRAQV